MKKGKLVVIGLLLGSNLVGNPQITLATDEIIEHEVTDTSEVINEQPDLVTETVMEDKSEKQEGVVKEQSGQSGQAESNLTPEQLAIVSSLPELSLAQVNRGMLARSAAATPEQTKLVTEVRRHLNKPYLWGGIGPNSFDCSGLAQYTYKQAINYNLLRVTWQQETQGREASLQSLQAGDLLFYGQRYNSTHVSIYIGNGIAIHAPMPGQRVTAYEIKWWAPQFARRIVSEGLPLIKNGSIVSLKSHALSYSDGSLVTAADRKKGFTITGFKDIPEKWGSRRLYSVKESKKWFYELDVAVQTSSQGLIKNGTMVQLKNSAVNFESGGKISTTIKNGGYVIENMKLIAKANNSIRAYKFKGLSQWFYENDVAVQSSKYKELKKGTVVALKKTATGYQSGGKITSSDRNKAYQIKQMRYIKKKANSIRAYQLVGHKAWFYEHDLQSQTSNFKEIKAGTKLVLKNSATRYQSGYRFSTADKNKVFVVQSMALIPKKHGSIRVYKMKGNSRWIYEHDLQSNTSSYKALKKGRHFTVKTSARSYQSGGALNRNDYKKTFVIGATRDIRRKYGSIRAYQAKGTKRWYYEADIKAK